MRWPASRRRGPPTCCPADASGEWPLRRPPFSLPSSGAGGALTLSAAALGTAPDLDLFLAQHRAITHSVGAVAAVFIVAGVVTGQVTGKVQRSKFKGQSAKSKFKVQSEALRVERALRVAAICAAAYGSHLLLDWLAIDRRMPYGLQVLWPFSDGWYISGSGCLPADRTAQPPLARHASHQSAGRWRSRPP